MQTASIHRSWNPLTREVPEQAMAQENREENAHKEEPRKNKPTLKWAAPPPINNADPNVSFAETKMYSVGQSQPKVVIGDRYPGFGTLNTALSNKHTGEELSILPIQQRRIGIESKIKLGVTYLFLTTFSGGLNHRNTDLHN